MTQSKEQIQLIEMVFEHGSTMGDDTAAKRALRRRYQPEIIKWTDRYHLSDVDRLIAILENIIRNNGFFDIKDMGVVDYNDDVLDPESKRKNKRKFDTAHQELMQWFDRAITMAEKD